MSELTGNEFALNKGASLKVQSANASLTFTKMGNQIIMNLSMPFVPDVNNIQIGPGTVNFYSCGVHTFDVPNYNSGVFKGINVRILDDEEEIILQSQSADFTVVTRGEKREHGSEALVRRLLAKLAIEDQSRKKD